MSRHNPPHPNPEEKIIRLDPFTDIGFKNLFGKEGQSEPLLLDFLNDIFEGIPGFENIKELSYRPKDRIRERLEQKGVIYDVNCETEDGHQFIVEMQRAPQDFFLKRAIYYVALGISEQGHKGVGTHAWEFDIKPVAGIFICNFKIRHLPPKLITHVHMADMEDGRSIGNYVHYVFIQPQLFNKSEEECATGFDIWMYYLKNLKDMQEIPFKTRKERVYERLDRLSRYAVLSDEEKYEYDAYLKWARDFNATLQTARRAALAEGEAKGRAEGIAEGVEKEKWESARNFHRLGVPLETIAEATGLPLPLLRERL